MMKTMVKIMVMIMVRNIVMIMFSSTLLCSENVQLYSIARGLLQLSRQKFTFLGRLLGLTELGHVRKVPLPPSFH